MFLNDCIYVITRVVCVFRSRVNYEKALQFVITLSALLQSFFPERFIGREVVEQELPVDPAEARLVRDPVEGELPNEVQVDLCCPLHGLQGGSVRPYPLCHWVLVLWWLLDMLLLFLLVLLLRFFCNGLLVLLVRLSFFYSWLMLLLGFCHLLLSYLVACLISVLYLIAIVVDVFSFDSFLFFFSLFFGK